MKIRWFIGALMILTSSASWSGGGASDSDAIETARRDLATRLKIPVERVEVDSHREVWSGTAMGCQRVGVDMPDVMAKGAQLVLIADGQKHYYHRRAGDDYQYCVTPATKRTGPIGAPVQ